ncbi:MAG TPA: DUF4845 domain-containing protein [Rhodocyclaceae bacterium]
MTAKTIKRQKGVTLISLIVICALLALVALLAIKVAPVLEEYLAVVKVVKATAQDPVSREGSVVEIRRDFDKRKQIDNITAIGGEDLDISKEGGTVVISFAYSKKIPLFAPVSLVFDFEGSSAK